MATKRDSEILRERCRETQHVIQEIRRLEAIQSPSEAELLELERLLARFRELNPFQRFAWIEGKPVCDIWAEILTLQQAKEIKK